jgi:tetratricopeptide (TPR) repeat protein
VATRDEFRLVRVRAAAALAPIRPETLTETERNDLDGAVKQFIGAMKVRLDDGASHYNMGNFHTARREFEQAIVSYETAIKLRPEWIPPLVNVSLVYNLMGQNDRAEQRLRRALEIEPTSAAANLNLGMLLGEMGRLDEAEAAFRSVLNRDPKSAQAAYNLGVIVAKDRMDEAIMWFRKACEINPDEPKYSYSLAFFLYQNGNADGAIRTLQQMLIRSPSYMEAYKLLGQIYEEHGEIEKAITVFRSAMENDEISEYERYLFEQRIRALQER